MKVLGRVGLHFLQILSVWQFKPNTITINHQLEFSETRVKYLDHAKRAYKHDIWSYRISESLYEMALLNNQIKY